MSNVSESTDNTTDQRRAEILAGYREMIDFLAAHPEVPFGLTHMNDYCCPGGDDEAFPELHRIAAALGVEVTGGPTHFYVTRKFGPVTYRAYHVTDREMADYDDAMKAYRRAREAAAKAEAEQVQPGDGA